MLNYKQSENKQINMNKAEILNSKVSKESQTIIYLILIEIKENQHHNYQDKTIVRPNKIIGIFDNQFNMFKLLMNITEKVIGWELKRK